MAFEPFGYAFEIRSSSRPAETKAAIRSGLKGWLDQTNGARGWIIGPFICLWFSAYDRHGPMLLGRFERTELGTRIKGRAGSDLNGLLVLAVLLPFLAYMLWAVIAGGAATPLLIGKLAVFLLLGVVAFWWAHKDRREAEPLVRFLEDALTSSGKTRRAKAAALEMSANFTLEIDGDPIKGAITAEAIHDALLALGESSFLVLASAPETYIQTACKDAGYILEKRDGECARHFIASRQGLASAGVDDARFTFEELHEAFLAYASGAPTPSFIRWERLNLAD